MRLYLVYLSTLFNAFFSENHEVQTKTVEYSIKIPRSDLDRIDEIAEELNCLNKGKVVEFDEFVIYRFSKEGENFRVKRSAALSNFTLLEEKELIRVKRGFIDFEKSKQTRYTSKYRPKKRVSRKRTIPRNYQSILYKYNDPYYKMMKKVSFLS